MLGLADDTADVNAYRKGGEPAIVWAADYGTPALVKALLVRGAKVDARDKMGCTALQYVVGNTIVTRRHIKNAQLLIAHGADVNTRENDGYTPLMSAHNTKMLHLLLKRGAKVNAAANDGFTALMDSVLEGSPEQMALLLAAGADVHARDSEGFTSLLLVASWLNEFSHEEDMAETKLLLEYGASVNDCDNKGKSVLWHAVRRMQRNPKAHEVVRLLLEAGAEAADENGSRLLAWAAKNGDEEIAALLVAAGAK